MKLKRHNLEKPGIMIYSSTDPISLKGGEEYDLRFELFNGFNCFISGFDHATHLARSLLGEHSLTCRIVVNGLIAGWKTEEPNLVNFLKQRHLTNPLIQFQTLLFLVLPVILGLYLSWNC